MRTRAMGTMVLSDNIYSDATMEYDCARSVDEIVAQKDHNPH